MATAVHSTNGEKQLAAKGGAMSFTNYAPPLLPLSQIEQKRPPDAFLQG